MTFGTIALILIALSVYSYWFVLRSGSLQNKVLIPFLYNLHTPNIMRFITDEEHDEIHRQADILNIRVLTCYIAAVIAVGVSALFLLLASQGGNLELTGTILTVAFAYVGANYDLNSKILNFVRLSESEIIARSLQSKAEASGFDNVADYLKDENDKMLKEWQEELAAVAKDFDEIMIDLGFDEERDYLESPESEQELVEMLEQASQKIQEKYPEPRDK